MKILQTFTDPTDWTAFYELTGKRYVARLQHNARSDRWYLQLTTEAGGAILTNQKLSTGCDLLAVANATGRPPGKLIVVPTNTKAIEAPGLETLGSDYVLAYFEPGELE